MGFSKNPLLDPKNPRWRMSDLDKILQTGAERHVDCDDMVEIGNRYRIPT